VQHPPGDHADQVNLALLALTYPAFRIGLEPGRSHRPRWSAVRKHRAAPGLYAVITPDLDELHAVLATASQSAEPGPHAGPREPDTSL
jgi:hypothetical protein